MIFPMRLLVLTVLACLAGAVPAGDERPTRYTAVVTGIVCQSCKATVVAALQKLPGVREVEFAKGDREGSHRLTFSASSAALTKNDAERALGEHLKEFAVLSLDKAEGSR